MVGTIIGWVIIGGIAGLIAQAITHQSADVSRAPNWLETIVVGVVGAVLGGWLLSLLPGVDNDGGFFWTLLTAVVGAVVLLSIVGAVRKNKARP